MGIPNTTSAAQSAKEALAELQTKLDIKALGELSEEEFEANKDLIKSEVRQRRAKHAVYENQRTLKAVDALESLGNLEEFGKTDERISCIPP